ncbi:MAG: hypothetical protein P8M64_00440 [Thermodesulfobacteriota bacteirum]|jgi:hypothetical protein|nr:hypothetical protein [bacterium]MDG2445317.1 hypothetical protein [Thermodesulfobacteriota bacterium]|tara:strand:+ start:20192 stop:20530 length:339 start_codon:yes stop_codon:yes gene_type:complete
MIIPVVTKDMIFFSKIKSLASLEDRIIHINSIGILDKLDCEEKIDVLIVDLSFNLTEQIQKFLIGKASLGYYPHIQTALKEKGEDLNLTRIVTRNQLIKKYKKILNELKKRV